MLRVSHDLSLPPNAVTQKMAVLGISGSGKTYGTGKLVEELLDAGAQVLIIDTVGNWGSLRLAADGKGPGIPIPILGGEQGDLPLDAGHGELVADTAVSTRSPLVIDVSDFTGGELRKFVTAFATALLRLKKGSRSPLMVVWEECQDIVPQRVMSDAAAMVGAVEKLIKKGRNYGIGTILISQRAAAVNKDVLNQVETLFCFRQNAKQDRKAIESWIVSKSIDVGELVKQLPDLPTGDCFCWSPQWLGVLKRIRFGKKRTFDGSATPEFGTEVPAGKLAPIDLEKLRVTMAATIERAKADDPKAPRARIAELEAQTAKHEPERVEVPVFDEEAWGRLKSEIEQGITLALNNARGALHGYKSRALERTIPPESRQSIAPKANDAPEDNRHTIDGLHREAPKVPKPASGGLSAKASSDFTIGGRTPVRQLKTPAIAATGADCSSVPGRRLKSTSARWPSSRRRCLMGEGFFAAIPIPSAPSPVPVDWIGRCRRAPGAPAAGKGESDG